MWGEQYIYDFEYRELLFLVEVFKISLSFSQRHVQGHMIEHNAETHHPLVIGFVDLSIWFFLGGSVFLVDVFEKTLELSQLLFCLLKKMCTVVENCLRCYDCENYVSQMNEHLRIPHGAIYAAKFGTAPPVSNQHVSAISEEDETEE